MNLIIHRGTNEIGGNCVELNGILFDYGLPLIAMDNQKFNLKDYKLDIKGLYKNEITKIKAVFLTHAHPDHYGLLELINSEIPIYVTKNTYDILKNITPLTNNFKTSELKLHIIDKPININNMKISAYEVDHNINGACAYKIETEDKTIAYTGDIRFHGRNTYKNQKFIKAIKNTDYLIMEGTTISRDNTIRIEEDDLIAKFDEVFNEDKLSLVIFSPQNLSRFCTIYKSCLNSKKTLVIDPYTAFMLDIFSGNNNKIPDTDSNNIKIYFAQNSIADKLAEANKLWKYKEHKISFEEIEQNPQSYVIKGNFVINNKILNNFNPDEINIVYSLWRGYLNKPNQLDKYKDVLKYIHTSGHAYVKDLQQFVEVVKPQNIIPIHTESKEKYKELFKSNIIKVNDGKLVEI